MVLVSRGFNPADGELPLPSKKNVAILVFDGVEVLDFAGPFEVFSRTRTEAGSASRRSEDTAPFRVFTVAKTKQTVVATGGLAVEPAHSFADAPAVDLLVVPGGFGTRSLLEDRATLEWLERVAASAELVTSVCTGSLLLAKAGLLRGKRATTHHLALDELESLVGKGATVERPDANGQPRFVDDGVVTSAGVSAGIDMAFHVVGRLCGVEVANETARYIEYPRRDDSRPGEAELG